MTAAGSFGGPQRTCVGCRRVAPSEALVRLTVREGRVTLAEPRPVGRGAWLCPQRRALDRALRARVLIDDDLCRRFTGVCEQRKAVM